MLAVGRWEYNKHNAKLDKTQMFHDKDVRYKLYASLLIDNEKGEPIALIGLELTNSKVLSRDITWSITFNRSCKYGVTNNSPTLGYNSFFLG